MPDGTATRDHGSPDSGSDGRNATRSSQADGRGGPFIRPPAATRDRATAGSPSGATHAALGQHGSAVLAGPVQSIADLADGEDVAWMGGLRLELGAQELHVRIHGAGPDGIAVLPHFA